MYNKSLFVRCYYRWYFQHMLLSLLLFMSDWREGVRFSPLRNHMCQLSNEHDF